MFRLCYWILLISCTISVDFVENSVIRKEGEQAHSLYNINDKVIVLTHENFYQTIFDQQYASNVEFYNSFCGFCRNFAPIYAAWAADVYDWRDIIKVAAIDCADDANNDICRDMEIMRYPTLKYFPPMYKNDTNNLGIEVVHAPMTVGEPNLIELLTNTTTPPNSWPNLKPIDSTSPAALFASLPLNIEYVFMVRDSKNDTILAQKVALDLHSLSSVQIRNVPSSIASMLGLNAPMAIYVAIKSTKSIEMVKHLIDLNRETIRSAIEDYLKTKGIQKKIQNPIEFDAVSPAAKANAVEIDEHENTAIIEYVKSHPGIVYQSDLELAIQFSIFHELVKYNHMNDEQVTALKRYLSILQKYSPLGDNGQLFLTELNAYVENDATNFNGKTLSEKIKELEKKHDPIFSSSKWIGCRPSVAGRRGFSCGLWQLFHYLTVQATNSDRSHDPLEVLQAIHGFVKHFFGCTQCSLHFQEMAKHNNIWKVTTKDEAVLWLWTAHNEVNQRLAGDHTEDPAFPKAQYPLHTACSQCHKQRIPVHGITPSDHTVDLPHWDTSEILYYLRRVYSHFNLNRYGVDNEHILPQRVTSVHSMKLQSTSSGRYSSVFSEMDVRMGILLYAFCMLIIVVAVKLFLKRGGYRKKAYAHDFLGKI